MRLFWKKEPERERIIRAIYQLPQGDVKTMARHQGVYRLRVGEYRVIFTKEDSVLLITIIDANLYADIKISKRKAPYKYGQLLKKHT